MVELVKRKLVTSLDYSAKLDAYNSLVEKIKGCEKLNSCNENVPDCYRLEKCLWCDEVNLWSYWLGGRNNLDAKILVVGQDWGNINGRTLNTLKYPTDGNPTDQRLCRLFDVLGYDIRKGNADPKNRDLFFTNFVLCYRVDKEGGGYQSKWGKNCSNYFSELISIIEPKVILCLGQATYNAVRHAAGLRSSCEARYNDTIEGGWKQIKFGDVSAVVFPLAHPGGFGTSNRARPARADGKSGEQLQIEDWEKVLPHLTYIN